MKFFFLLFSFHVQLRLGNIIALQSLVGWGSCGSQHFPFRPGLPSAHRQHQDEWALKQHRGESFRASADHFQNPRGSGEHAGKQSAALSLGLYRGSGCMCENRRSGLFPEMHRKLLQKKRARKHAFYLGFTFHTLTHLHVGVSLLCVCHLVSSVLLKNILKYPMRQERVLHIQVLWPDFLSFPFSHSTGSKFPLT